MRISPMCEFPLEEYRARITALTGRMRAAGLDGMMLSSRENTRYFCGLQSVIWPSKVSTPGILLVNADGKTALIGSASAVETARHTSVLDREDVFCYDRNNLPGTPSTYPDAVSDAFRRLGLSEGRIGAEFGESCYLHLQYHWYLELCRLLPGVQFVDAGEEIFHLRSVKSPAEVDLLREACRRNEESIKAALSSIVPGQTTERDVLRHFAGEAFHRHCENVRELSVRFSNRRVPLAACPAGDVLIEAIPHAPVFAGGGLLLHGYQAYWEHTAVLRAPTPRQQELFDCARRTAEYACKELRAGASLGGSLQKINAFAASTSAGAVCQTRRAPCAGIGLDPAEPPYFRTACQAPLPLLEGNVLWLSPCFGTETDGLFSCCVTLVVTSSGAQLLSSFPESLIAVALP